MREGLPRWRRSRTEPSERFAASDGGGSDGGQGSIQIAILCTDSNSVRNRSGDRNLEHFRRSHDVHYRTLKDVEAALKKRRLRYHKAPRGPVGDKSRYTFVVTVGGDGTVLEAARGLLPGIPLLGVNSDPNHSVGRFCAADRGTFEGLLDGLLSGRVRTVEVQRLKLRLQGRRLAEDALNDVLVTHCNPAAMSHYVLKIAGCTEQQRSSGIWVSTAAGSSGAAMSAGACKLPLIADKFLYQPRELYGDKRYGYRMTGEALKGHVTLRLRSLMREGMIYIDGAHHYRRFGYGATLEVCRSPRPLTLVQP